MKEKNLLTKKRICYYFLKIITWMDKKSKLYEQRSFKILRNFIIANQLKCTFSRLAADSPYNSRFLPKCERKGNLCGDKPREVPIDPSAHHHHGDHTGHVTLHHLRHHAGVSHGVGGSHCLSRSNLFLTKV